jgi:hypothetical protein
MNLDMADRLVLTWHPNVPDMKLGLALASWGTRGRAVRSVFLQFVLPGILFGFFMGSVELGVAFGLLFGAFFMFAFPAVLARMLVRGQLARAKSHDIIISNEVVERHVAGTVVQQPWSAVTRVLELPNAFILFSGATAVGSIEKSAMPDLAVLEAVRNLISSLRTVYVRASAYLALETRPNEV